MAMDVEYEEYAATTSSKHHGWKVQVSQQHVERRAALAAARAHDRVPNLLCSGTG